MNVFVDSGVLLRLVVPSTDGHDAARRAIKVLRGRGDRLVALTQNAAEFWNACTRPTSVRGGFGLSIETTARKLRLIQRLVQIRSDSDAIFNEWKRLVVAYSVRGVQAHDARIVAAMSVYGIANLLTFNAADFRRYSEVTVLAPSDVQ
jgi:predicted nucleic acid-binding protein